LNEKKNIGAKKQTQYIIEDKHDPFCQVSFTALWQLLSPRRIQPSSFQKKLLHAAAAVAAPRVRQQPICIL